MIGAIALLLIPVVVAWLVFIHAIVKWPRANRPAHRRWSR